MYTPKKLIKISVQENTNNSWKNFEKITLQEKHEIEILRRNQTFWKLFSNAFEIQLEIPPFYNHAEQPGCLPVI